MNSLNPFFLYGTAWKENDTERCVVDAINSGFKGIDTANQRKHYCEAAVGDALKKIYAQRKIKREDLFLQTKYTYQRGQDHRLPYDPKASFTIQVEQSFESSLQHLNTEYIDSYVLHGPFNSSGISIEDIEVWQAMEKIYESGKIKSLGVSNVSLEQLKILFEKSKVKPRFLQNRCYASKGWDREIRKFCTNNSITYQGFSLLTANQQIFDNPKIIEICAKMDCTIAQAIFCFSLQVGMLPLTGTTDLIHMKEDLESYRFKLDDKDIKQIEEILIV